MLLSGSHLVLWWLFHLICVFAASRQKFFKNASAFVTEEEDSQFMGGFYYPNQQQLSCSLGSSCVPIDNCPLMSQLLQRSCLQTDKLNGLTCGYRGSTPLVCCPDSCPTQQTQPSQVYSGTCGQSLLYNYWPSRYQGVGAHPWAVRVGFINKLTNQVDYLCCGSIINMRTILTAAHCALAKTSTHKISSVRVGEYDCNTDPDCSQGICASNVIDAPLNHVIVHPNYDPQNFKHNIALLVLKKPLNFSLSVQPVCMYPKLQNYDFSGRKAVLVGWGKLANQIEASSKLQQLELPVQPLSQCSVVYGQSVPISQNQLCVGGEAGRDACSGFGGAPLLLLDQNTRNRYYQIGLVSFGSDRCGQQGVPSVYTRLDKYTDWIITNSAKD